MGPDIFALTGLVIYLGIYIAIAFALEKKRQGGNADGI